MSIGKYKNQSKEAGVGPLKIPILYQVKLFDPPIRNSVERAPQVFFAQKVSIALSLLVKPEMAVFCFDRDTCLRFV